MQPAWGVANLTFLGIDLSQQAPRAHTLEEAQALIDELWLVLRAQAHQMKAGSKNWRARSRSGSGRSQP